MTGEKIPSSICDRPAWMKQARRLSMPLDFNMIYAAVLLRNGGRPIGTGFMVTVESAIVGTEPYPYLVTAQHVIHGEDRVEAVVPNPFGAIEYREPMPITNWEQPLPGIDLAIAPIDPDAVAGQFMAIPTESQMLRKIESPMLGGTVFYVGLWAPLGGVEPRMMARSGTIGALEQWGITAKIKQSQPDLEFADFPIHLIDCRSYEGFSGSPCFYEIQIPGLDATDRWRQEHGNVIPDNLTLGTSHYLTVLCGMFIAHSTDHRSITANPEGAVSRYGIGLMLRNQEIQAGLDAPVFRAARGASDGERMRTIEAGNVIEATSAVAPTGDLMSALLQVPKEEADEVHRRHDQS